METATAHYVGAYWFGLANSGYAVLRVITGNPIGGTGASVGKVSDSYRLRTLSVSRKKKDRFEHPLSLPGETFYERFDGEEDIARQGKERSADGKSDITLRTKDLERNMGMGRRELVEEGKALPSRSMN